MPTRKTEYLIEELIAALHGPQASARQRHGLRQTLYSLVRLGRAEQLMEMRRDSERAGGLCRPGPRANSAEYLVAAPQRPHPGGGDDGGDGVDQPISDSAMAIGQETLDQLVKRAHRHDGGDRLDGA